MQGRKTSIVESLFKSAPADSTFKTKRVKCIFCSTILSKNGTCMVNHIRKCKKCTDDIKAKYLTSSFHQDSEELSEDE